MKTPANVDILPRSSKEPLRASAFWVAQHANSQLTPLFPYRGPGDIVPCVAAQRGGRDHGYFVHENTVDELLVTFGAGGGGRARTGLLRLGPREHGVSGPAADNPAEFVTTVVVQRQAEAGPQKEAVIFKCSACSADVYRRDFDAFCAETDEEGRALPFPPLSTIAGSAAAALAYNEDPALRTCAKCGHVNPPFPLESWGWDNHVRRSGIVNGARRSLEESQS